MHAFWNNSSLKPPVARKLAVRHTIFMCLTSSFITTGSFVKLFHKFPWFFHDYTGFFKFHDFSMHGFFWVVFQVFHGSWEPCIRLNILIQIQKRLRITMPSSTDSYCFVSDFLSAENLAPLTLSTLVKSSLCINMNIFKKFWVTFQHTRLSRLSDQFWFG